MCCEYSTSGSPVAIDVRSDKIPLRSDADSTTFQSTDDSTVAVPMQATAVCAMVRTALMSDAFMNSFIYLPFPLTIRHVSIIPMNAPNIKLIMIPSIVGPS